jgi:hypothetical protein
VKTIRPLLALVLALTALRLAVSARAADPGDAFFSARPGALATTKARLAAGDVTLRPALAALVKNADDALKVTPPSVTHKSKLAPDGDPHAYASTAPYFWPDPSKPDGLPYVPHDGKVNPESRTAASDLNRSQDMARAVEHLALAYYFTGKPAYAEHAARCLRVWFLDPATSMKPHLNFGQGNPVKNSGRNIGVIEGGSFPATAEASGLLVGSAVWNTKDAAALRTWMAAYLDWLTTSKLGLEEAAEKQNHGSLYDVQVMRLALFTGRTDLAKQTAETVKTKRIAVQIEPDGRQPLELRRTKALSYSRLNLRALSTLATMAERVGVDLWNFSTADGRSIRKALDFMVPYVKTPPEPWPYQQIVKLDLAELAPIYRQAAVALHHAPYEQLASSYPNIDRAVFQLIHPSAR